MKRPYVSMEAIKINIDPTANVVTGYSQCWATITNKMEPGTNCTTEEEGHVNDWLDPVNPAYVQYGAC